MQRQTIKRYHIDSDYAYYLIARFIIVIIIIITILIIIFMIMMVDDNTKKSFKSDEFNFTLKEAGNQAIHQTQFALLNVD